MTLANNELPISQHFVRERVADGVYAAIVVPGTGAWGNAGIVDLGDATLIVDSCLTPSAARDLHSAAEALTGRPVTYVVNTHYHADHVLGNAVFNDALIIATGTTRELVAERTGGLVAGLQAATHGHSQPALLAALEDQTAATADEALRADLRTTLAEYRAFAADLPSVALRLPDLTFDEQLTLHGPARSAQLLTYGGGHTPSDLFVYLPAERMLFAGDLVQVGTHPSFSGDPREWIAILGRMEALDVATLVPGHGPVGTREAIPTMRRYLEDLLALAGEQVARGASADELARTPVPTAYASWAARDIFRDNLRFLQGYLTAGSKSGSKSGSDPHHD